MVYKIDKETWEKNEIDIEKEEFLECEIIQVDKLMKEFEPSKVIFNYIYAKALNICHISKVRDEYNKANNIQVRKQFFPGHYSINMYKKDLCKFFNTTPKKLETYIEEIKKEMENYNFSNLYISENKENKELSCYSFNFINKKITFDTDRIEEVKAMGFVSIEKPYYIDAYFIVNDQSGEEFNKIKEKIGKD